MRHENHTDKPPKGDRRFWGEGKGFTKYSQTFLAKQSQSFHKGIHKALTRAFTKLSQEHSQSSHKDIHKALTNSLARSAAIFFRAAPRARMRSSPARSAAIFSGSPPRARTRRGEKQQKKKDTNLAPRVSFQQSLSYSHHASCRAFPGWGS